MRVVKTFPLVFLQAIACIVVFSAIAEAAQSVTSPPPPALQAKPQGPARISGGVIAGNLVTRVNPDYPIFAKQHHIAGAVVLHAIIGKDGSVKSLEAVSGPDMLKQSALDAVKHWKYKPYLLNGEPTEIDTTITVNFNINRGR